MPQETSEAGNQAQLPLFSCSLVLRTSEVLGDEAGEKLLGLAGLVGR